MAIFDYQRITICDWPKCPNHIPYHADFVSAIVFNGRPMIVCYNCFENLKRKYGLHTRRCNRNEEE